MSEVQRFWSYEASNIRCVREADFDRVTAERDALAQNLKFAEEGSQSFAEECDALQQRLTAADERRVHWMRLSSEATCRAVSESERADVLEGLLREVQKSARKQDWASGYPTLFASVDAALKPADSAAVTGPIHAEGKNMVFAGFRIDGSLPPCKWTDSDAAKNNDPIGWDAS